MNWTEMKAKVEAQMATDPQRGTLSTRAWQQVEEGLRHLTGVGFQFEIAPRGTLAELTESRAEAEPPTKPLSMSTAIGLVTAAKKSPLTSKFEAMTAEAG